MMIVKDFFPNLKGDQPFENTEIKGSINATLKDNILFKALRKELSSDDGEVDVAKAAELVHNAAQLMVADTSVDKGQVRDFICGVAYNIFDSSVEKIAKNNPIVTKFITETLFKTEVPNKVIDFLNHLV